MDTMGGSWLEPTLRCGAPHQAGERPGFNPRQAKSVTFPATQEATRIREISSLPRCVEERVEVYDHLVIHGFPAKIKSNHEVVGNWVEMIVEKIQAESAGEWVVVLEERGCFAVALPIKEKSCVIQSLVVTFTWEFINIMGGMGPTGVACTYLNRQHAKILKESPRVCGVFRGLGGQIEELDLRMKVAQEFFCKKVPSFVILGRFVTGYGSSPAHTSWMPQIGGILMGMPSVNLEAMESKIGRRTCAGLPRTQGVGAFRFELYDSLSVFHSAQFGSKNLLGEKGCLLIRNVDKKLGNPAIIRKLVEAKVIEDSEILAVYARKTGNGNSEVKEVCIATKKGFASGAPELSQLGNGCVISVSDLQRHQGMEEQFVQRSDIMAVDKRSKWLAQGREGGGVLSMAEPRKSRTTSYASATGSSRSQTPTL